jgi:hypothetical protein
MLKVLLRPWVNKLKELAPETFDGALALAAIEIALAESMDEIGDVMCDDMGDHSNPD